MSLLGVGYSGIEQSPTFYLPLFTLRSTIDNDPLLPPATPVLEYLIWFLFEFEFI